MKNKLNRISKIILYFSATYIVFFIFCLFTMKKLDRILMLSLFKNIIRLRNF